MLERIKTFFGCFFCWKVKPSKNLEEVEVFIAQSFGLRKNSPGLSNERLADEIRKLHKMYPRPLILQWEVADCVPELKNGIVLRIEKHRISNKYLDSKEVKTQAAIKMKEEGWKTAILISHPCHNWRCKKILEHLKVQVLIPLLDDIPYDRESTQRWTRNWLFWVIREVPTRIFYFLKGWI